MISIFNGRVRTLGGPGSDVHAQISVDFRQYLHLLKGAKLAVFLAIALHADQNGWAYPSYERLQQETGYGRGTIANALADLCQMTIEGHRLLLRYQPRDDGEKFKSNRYLIFPSADEVTQYDEAGVQHLGGDAHKKKPCTENPDANHNQEEPEPSCHDDDGRLALVAGFGLDLSKTVRRLVPQYTCDQLTYAWQRAQQGRRPKGLFVSYLKTGDMPNPPAREQAPSPPDCPGCGQPTLSYQLCQDCGRCPDCCTCEPEPADPIVDQARQVWEAALGELALQMSKGTFNTWLKPTRVVSRENGAFVIGVDNAYMQDWLDNRLRPTVERTLSGLVEGEVEVQFIVVNAQEDGR